MKNKVLAKAMSRFIYDEQHSKGLFIGGFPTGLGKTYESCFMMLEEINRNPDLKFIFITEQTKNLPYDTLVYIAKNEFKMSDSKINSIVLPLESNIKSFSNNYKEYMKIDILKHFEENGINKRVLTNVIAHKNAYRRAQSNPENIEQKKIAEENLSISEREFRKAIRNILRRYDNEKIRLQHIRDDDDLKWISEIYPGVFFDECRIILMSDKKFLYSIDTLITTPFTIWSETDLRSNKDTGEEYSRLKDHIIIIDEFDTNKNVMQSTIIDEKKDEVDAIKSFRDLTFKLPQWTKLPAKMVIEGSWWKKYQNLHIEERFRNLIEKANDIKTNNHTEYHFKLTSEGKDGEYTENEGSSFMFRDYEPYTVGNAFTVKTDDKERYNYIITGKGITSNPTRLSVLFDMLNRFTNSFSRLVRDLALNYRDNLSDDANEDRKSFPNCVDSILDAMELDERYSNYIRTKVLHNRLKSSHQRRTELLEPTVYSRGFSYVSMRDSPSAQLKTRLYYTEYDITPEFILRHMCEETKVIGLSATGDIDSPFCNFSVNYLRDVGVHIHEFNDDEMGEIRERIDSNSAGFKKDSEDSGDAPCKINTKKLSMRRDYSVVSWEEVFNDEDVAERIDRHVRRTGDVKEYFIELRYVRAALVLKKFIEHGDIRSMLCFFTAHAKDIPDHDFNVGKLDEIFIEVAKQNDVSIETVWSGRESEVIHDAGPEKKKIVIYQINGLNFDYASKDVKRRLSDGEYVMVLTAYQTLGAGQNLQYPIPKGVPAVWIRSNNAEKVTKEKDFDAIYLDSPKNIGPQIEDHNKSSLDNYLFYAEYADASNQIEIGSKRQQINKAFHVCYSNESNGQPKQFKDTDIYLLAKAHVVMQAIGRICRTGWKNPNIYVFMDPELADDGTFSMKERDYGKFLNYEFREVYRAVHEEMEFPQSEKDKKEMNLLINSAIRTSHNFIALVDDMRYAVYGGDDNAIEKWENWREFVLKNPTGPADISQSAGFEREAYRFGYVKLPKDQDHYYFSVKYDFYQDSTDGLDINFERIPRVLDKDKDKKKWFVLSSQTAKLDMMLKIDGVKDMLVDRGYAVKFNPSERMMSPPLFRNIYMGALGEVVGKYLVEKDCGVDLLPMPHEYYEQFDFVSKDGTYYDFKDWNELMYEDDKEKERILRKIVSKLERCKGDTAYVINVVVDGSKKYESYHKHEFKGKTIITIPYLYSCGGRKPIINDDAIEYITRGCE